jgi:hypothetical protein
VATSFVLFLNSHRITYVSRLHRQIRLMILISQMEKRFVLYSVRILHKITRTKSQTVDCLALCVTTRFYIPIIFGIFVPLSVHIIQGVEKSNILYNFFSTVKPTRCTISQIYFIWNNTLLISDGLSAHHQESKCVHTASGICHQVQWLLAMT